MGAWFGETSTTADHSITTHDLTGLWSAMHGYHSAMEDEQFTFRELRIASSFIFTEPLAFVCRDEPTGEIYRKVGLRQQSASGRHVEHRR